MRKVCFTLIILAAVLSCAVPATLARSYKFQPFDYAGATSTFANGINNAGHIVGSYSNSTEPFDRTGFLKIGDNYSSIKYPGATSTTLSGINDAGQIVGYYSDINSLTSHGFIATPLPTVPYLLLLD